MSRLHQPPKLLMLNGCLGTLVVSAGVSRALTGVLWKVCVLGESWRMLSTSSFLCFCLKLMGYFTETPVETGGHEMDVDFLSFDLYFSQCLA